MSRRPGHRLVMSGAGWPQVEDDPVDLLEGFAIIFELAYTQQVDCSSASIGGHDAHRSASGARTL